MLFSSLAQCGEVPQPRLPGEEDPYLWLEEVAGEQALAWVRERNAESRKVLAEQEGFGRLEERLLGILDSQEKIPHIQKRGSAYYNFWRDGAHPRGLWRRTSLEEYRKERPAWETVLDLDALSQAERENWVWHGADFLRPACTRCLLSLSRGGADAEVLREFDLVRKAFVQDGFLVPEAKNNVSWRDLDALFVGTDFGPGSMTQSGYPRQVRLWRRGTPLAGAQVIYEGQPEDVSVSGFRDLTPGFERDLVVRGITFYRNEVFLLREGRLVKLEKPEDAKADLHREWLLLELRSDWSVGGKRYAAGSLLVSRLEEYLAGRRDLELLFAPRERVSLAGFTPTRNRLLLSTLDNVRSRLLVLTPGPDGWSRQELPGLPEFGEATVRAVEEDEGDDYFLYLTDFTSPTSLQLGTLGKGPAERLKQTPAFFDSSRLLVSQHEARSQDGTRIPYFQVAPRDLAREGRSPTLLTGYGGFEISLTPHYDGLNGAAWLERGGVYVVANIRGGGEFGPAWHQAALKANRPRAYEDFAAVARDLLERKVTDRAHLGLLGGSNGGLLVGNMLTRYPELFKAAVCQVPLLDLRRYHLLLAGASWMGEYGNPDDPAEWAFLKGFSPYHQVRAGVKYPKLLLTTSTRDDRVHPGHARKMVARLRDLGHEVLYYENIEGGHGGAANHKQAAFLTALAYSFLWKELR